MPASFIQELIILIAAAFVGGFVARSIRVPTVVGYLASGVFFGAIGTNFLTSHDTLVHLSEIGISLLLFTLGFEMSLDTLRQINLKIVLIGIGQIILTSVCLLFIFLFITPDIKVAFLFGILFSFSSTAVIVKLLDERDMLKEFPGTHIFILLLLQDLLVIPLFFFLPLLFTEQQISSGIVFGFLGGFIRFSVIFVAIFLAAKFLIPKLINILFRFPSHELNILATIFLAAITIGALRQLGLPESIAAFLAGVVISEQGKNITPLTEIRPFRDVFLVLFFVMTGMLVDLQFLIHNIGPILLLSIAIIIAKFTVMYGILRLSGYFPTSSVFASSYLTNVGEFALVMGQVTLLNAYITKTDYNVLLSTFIVSLMLVPLSIRFLPLLGARFASLNLITTLFGKSYEESFGVTQVYRSLQQHVVLCGHGRVGLTVRKLLDLSEIEYVVVDFDKRVVSRLQRDGKNAFFGDPTDRDVLDSVGVAQARMMIISLSDPISQKKIIRTAIKINPSIVIIVRSQAEEEVQDLIAHGAHITVVPSLETGLKIGEEILKEFGVDQPIISALKKRLHAQAQ